MFGRVVMSLGIPLMAIASASLVSEVERPDVAIELGISPAITRCDVPTCESKPDSTPVATPALGRCSWHDSNGADVGRVITYIPPDTPASGGYTCKGPCLWNLCATGDPQEEGGGVWSQSCYCYQIP